jgi:hypothetical protein
MLESIEGLGGTVLQVVNSLIRAVQTIPVIRDVQMLQLKLNSDVPDGKEWLGGTVLQVVNSLIRGVQIVPLNWGCSNLAVKVKQGCSNQSRGWAGQFSRW